VTVISGFALAVSESRFCLIDLSDPGRRYPTRRNHSDGSDRGNRLSVLGIELHPFQINQPLKLKRLNINVHSFIQAIYIAPLQVRYYSEALPTVHGYCAGVSRRSATGNCELRTYPRSLRGG